MPALCLWRMSGRRGRGMQTEQLLRVSQVSVAQACPHVGFHERMFSPRCASVCDAFMVTDSFHLSCPFTLKRQLPVKKKKKEALWTASLHRQPQLLLTQAPRNLLCSAHTLLNQHASRRRRPVNGETAPRGVEAWKRRVCWANTGISVRNVALSISQNMWVSNGDNKLFTWVRYILAIGSPQSTLPLLSCSFLIFHRHLRRHAVKPLKCIYGPSWNQAAVAIISLKQQRWSSHVCSWKVSSTPPKVKPFF